MDMIRGPLVMSPYNVNRAVREKVLTSGVNSLLPRERRWWNDMIRREQYMANLRPTIRSNYFKAELAPAPPVTMTTVPTQEEAQSGLNRRLKSTLRKARSAERRRNRRTQRQLWKELANIGQEYQQQGRRYSERMRELKAELNAPKPVVPIPVARPVKKAPMSTAVMPPPVSPSMPPLLSVEEETYREPPASWRDMSPLRGGRAKTRKYRRRM